VRSELPSSQEGDGEAVSKRECRELRAGRHGEERHADDPEPARERRRGELPGHDGEREEEDGICQRLGAEVRVVDDGR
jgi:hypothetical protein